MMNQTQLKQKLLTMEQKQKMGIKLTGAETRLLEQVLVKQLFKQRGAEYREDGKIKVVKQMDVEPLIHAIPAYAELHAQNPSAGRKYTGSIDLYTAQNWSQECGAAVGTKEFAAYAKKKLDSGEFDKFRAPLITRYH